MWQSVFRLVVFCLGLMIQVRGSVGAEGVSLPQPPLAPSLNPLCDSALVPCVAMDDLAAHAFAHFVILPSTQRRGSGVVIPYGVSMGILGRLSLGIASQLAVVSLPEQPHQSHGPLRMSATVLLWPLWPLRVQSDLPATGEYGSYYVPPRGFRLGLSVDQQWRVGPFQAANSLGLSTDLSMVRLIATKAMGPFELTASLGALVDSHQRYATAEVGGQLGLYLPGVPAFKVSLDGLFRGIPSTVQPDFLATLPDFPLRTQGALGLGLAYKPDARVDFGVSVYKGWGGIAPVTVVLRFLLVSVGRSYEGRAATSLTQLGADAAALGAERLRDAVERLLRESPSDFPIDPKLDDQCFIRDDDGKIMGQFGTRTPGGGFCEKDGVKVPIGHMLWRDERGDKLCRDHQVNPTTKSHELRDCLLWRSGKEWHPAHQVRLNDRCELRDDNGALLGRLGQRSVDGSRCLYPVSRSHGGYNEYQETNEQPVDGIFYTDKERSTVCETPGLHRCFLKPGVGRTSLRNTDGERFASGFGKGIDERVEGGRKLGEVAEGIASGRVGLGPIKDQLVDDLTEAAHTVRDREKLRALAKEKAAGWRQAIDDWLHKPTGDKLEDAGKLSSGVAIDALSGAALGSVGRGLKGAEEVVEDAAKAAKPGRFIVDRKGNVLIEPKGGSTHGNATGTFVETRYPNGSPAYQLHEGHPKTKAKVPHGHHMEPGSGPGRGHEGASLDRFGNRVPAESADAHWPVKQ